jgi:hypothetical protein
MQQTLRDGGRGASAAQRLRGALVVGQISLGAGAAGGATLMIRSFVAASRADLASTPRAC